MSVLDVRENRKEMVNKQWTDSGSRLVQRYDYWHDLYIPHRWKMIDVFARLKNAYRPDARKFLDVGSGTGAVAHRLFDDDHSLRGDLLDGSSPMLEQAKERLADFDAHFFCRDLNEPDWFSRVEGEYPVITSNIAIHHLEDVRKKEVFTDIYGMLPENGIFIYGDLIRWKNTVDEDRAFSLWTHEIRANFERAGEPLRDFATMKEKLIAVGKEEGDDPGDVSFLLEALTDVGFRDVCMVWFYIKFAVIFGIK